MELEHLINSLKAAHPIDNPGKLQKAGYRF